MAQRKSMYPCPVQGCTGNTYTEGQACSQCRRKDINWRKFWFFTDANGEQRGRELRSYWTPSDPNLDRMTVAELREFIQKYLPSGGPRLLFPKRPRGFQKVARRLVVMADLRLKWLEKESQTAYDNYNRQYKLLPVWAQFPRAFDFGKMTPGAVRKYAPKGPPRWIKEAR